MKDSELAQLKEELSRLSKENARLAKDFAALQRRFTEISQCISVERPDKGVPGTPTLSLRCSIISLYHPDHPNRLVGLLGATEDGGYLWLNGTDEKSHVILDVEKNTGRLLLRGKDSKEAVHLWVDEPKGRGTVAVFENGKPRACMKVAENGTGGVSVVHDDGHARAAMVATEFEGGEVFAVTPDMQMGVKLTGGMPDGGAVIVNHANGKAAVMLGCVNKLGAMINFNTKGKKVAAFPMPKDLQDR